MTYKSDVKFVLMFAEQESRDELMAHAHLLMSDTPGSLLRFYESVDPPVGRYSHAPWHIRGEANRVPWHAGSEAVSLHDDVVALAKEKYLAQYVFVRIGEDPADIEIQMTDDVVVEEHIAIHSASRFT